MRNEEVVRSYLARGRQRNIDLRRFVAPGLREIDQRVAGDGCSLAAVQDGSLDLLREGRLAVVSHDDARKNRLPTATVHSPVESSLGEAARDCLLAREH